MAYLSLAAMAGATTPVSASLFRSRSYGAVPVRDVSRSLRIVAAVAVIATVVITLQQLWLTRQGAVDAATQQVSRLDMVFAEQTGRAIETADVLLRNAADYSLDLVRASPADVGDALRRRSTGIRQLSAMAVADQNGFVIAASRPELLGALPPAGMAALSITRVENEPTLRISEPLRDPDGHWVALMTRRIVTKDGRFGGLALAYLNLSYFEDFYQAVEMPEGGSILLHLRNGTVLARFPKAEGVIGMSFADQPPFTEILSHATSGTVLMTSPIDGTYRILAIHALKMFPLAVSVSVGQAQVLAAWWSEVWVFCAAAVFGGLGMVGMLLHLSRQAREEELADRLLNMHELTRVASLDALTGLLNRTTLTDRLDSLLSGAERDRTQVALLFVDLDGFKQINDVQGHKAGDAVLRIVAGRLASTAAAVSADVARWGGDEFVIIAAIRHPARPGTPSDAMALASDILRVISLPVDVEGQTVRVGGTVGLATYPQDGSTPDVLVSAADAAMYAGKQSGGNVVRVYDPVLAHAVAVSANLERDLREALSDGSLSLVYQPIIQMPGERCVAFEALMRWDHPVRGSVPPTEFIPVAEHSGLIGRLGRWVLDRACVEAMTWRVEDAPSVTVNVSLAQVLSGVLARDVANALQRSGLPPHRLQLELTESMVGADHLRIVPILQEVREMGVGIALDDFGTGFSSLSRLRDWPVNIVKIDKSFVRSMDKDGTAVIRATLLVAHEYGLHVTVEGVETVEQWRELTGLGVRSFQGYLFSRPLDVTNVSPWLERVSQPRLSRTRGLGWVKLEQSALLDDTAADFAGV